MLATMDCPMTTIVLLCLLIGSTLSAPQQAPAPAGAPNAGVLPIALPVHAIPHSGIVGAFDNFGAGIANFGNAQGSGFDAILSGVFNSIGTLFSGLFGSGAVNTAFLNYNNRPPVDPNAGGAPPPPPGGAGGAGGGGGAAPEPEPEE